MPAGLPSLYHADELKSKSMNWARVYVQVKMKATTLGGSKYDL